MTCEWHDYSISSAVFNIVFNAFINYSKLSDTLNLTWRTVNTVRSFNIKEFNWSRLFQNQFITHDALLSKLDWHLSSTKRFLSLLTLCILHTPKCLISLGIRYYWSVCSTDNITFVPWTWILILQKYTYTVRLWLYDFAFEIFFYIRPDFICGFTTKSH